jgi:hypothetical protein
VCFATSIVPTTCVRCEIPLHDALGREVPIDRAGAARDRSIRAVTSTGVLAVAGTMAVAGLVAGGSVVAPLAIMAGALSAALVGALGVLPAGAVATRLARPRPRRAVRRTPVANVADVAVLLDVERTGTIAIRGRVRALAGVADDPTIVARTAELDSASGRFEVHDGTGIALVDEDAFVVWSYSGDAPRPQRWGGVVRDGDEVVVIGPARPASPEEAANVARGYRRAPAVAVFDGTARDRVAILVRAA